MHKKTGIGIIGCGMIAKIHIEAIRSIEEAELIGVAGASASEAERFAAEIGTYPFSGVEALLASDAVDVVCICTPSGLHERQAVQAAKAGKHVIVEKPLATTAEGAEAVIRACRENGVKGTVISQLRFSDAVRETKRAIVEGRLGKIIMVNLHMKYYRSPDYYAGSGWHGTWAMDGGGALMNQGIHGMDEMIYLVGEPKTVFGNARTLVHSIETEDNVVACFTFENGAVGTVCASTAVLPAQARVLEIHGDRGSIIIREDSIAQWNVPGEENREFADEVANTAADPKAVRTGGHILQIRDFLSAIKEDRTPFIPLEDGKKTVEVITAVYKASETGRVIAL
ncbi:MAG: Gfo/Idh/MocA family oxidoreductase [Ruminococcaceae bacterium]|nr:Gfo/Idh/MocA family oxidoreductase [Oscillospiraceae bacterium]